MTPPPAMEEVRAAKCHPDYAICLDHDNTASLIRNVEKLTGYTAQAWALCGEQKAQ